jgi:hypothetical protein
MTEHMRRRRGRSSKNPPSQEDVMRERRRQVKQAERAEKRIEQVRDRNIEVDWSPQEGPQTAFIHCTWADEIFFGGARGGGKTDAVLGKLLIKALMFEKYMKGIVFRREMPQLEAIIARAKEMFCPHGAEFREQQKIFRFPNGATIKFRFLDRDTDAEKYQGHDYCVAVGTPVLMADGSYKPIERVVVGDLVATLEGPKRVLRTTVPYEAECVEYRVRDRAGNLVGQQVHPITHPVLSSVELLSKPDMGQSQNGGRQIPFRQSWQSVLRHPALHLIRKGVGALLEGDRSDHGVFADGRPAPGQLLLLSVPVVLHAGKIDERLHDPRGDARGVVPSPIDVGGHVPESSLWDETGNIPGYDPRPSFAYIHPYTGELRHITARTELGHAEVFYVGSAWVSDLTVDGANHYITSSGLVNCNTDIAIEEAGNFPNIAPILKLKGTLRSARGVPCQMYLTGNPGGPGQGWIRSRYIDPAPNGWTPIRTTERRRLPNGKTVDVQNTRIYIPSRITDNRILLENDPGYISRLAEVGSEQLVRAWLEGDFWAIEGAFYPEYDPRRHVIPPCELPGYWMRFRAIDWGSYYPFGVLWFAVASEDWEHPTTGTLIPRGALVAYREWYGVRRKLDGTVEANRGCKLTAEQVANGILRMEIRGEKPSYTVMDPSAFSVQSGPSIAERMRRRGVPCRRADNKRSATNGAMSGHDQVRARLTGDGDPDDPDNRGRPMLFIFHHCHHLMRTLPMMQHDPDHPEDMAKEGEDHLVDALRYGCMSRPWIRKNPRDIRLPRSINEMTLDDLWDNERSPRVEQYF